MKRRRWVVVGLAVVALAAVFFVVALRIEPSPPFKFIKGRKVHTEVLTLTSGGSMLDYPYIDLYVFPGSVESVRKEAAKELAPLGYGSLSRNGSLWAAFRSRAYPVLEIGDASTGPLWLDQAGRPVEVPPGSVLVEVRRHEPNFIERVQEWARGIGL